MRRRTTSAALAVAMAAATAAILPAAQAASDTQPDVATVSARTANPGKALTKRGTLLYIKNHNLWMARGDGSSAEQLTRDGTASSPYMSPSMADNGRFAVAKGEQFFVYAPTGKLISSWTPERLFMDSQGGILTPPFDPVLSPNGDRIAYEQVRTYTSGGRIVTEGLTGITPLSAGGFYDILLYNDPTWLTNNRVMLGTGSISLYNVDSDATDYPSTHWFDADDYLDLGDFEWNELGDPSLSPDGRTMMVSGASGNQLHWVSVTGDPKTSIPPAPTQLTCMAYEEQEPPYPYLSHYENPDFGPESDSAIFEQYGSTYRIDGIGACDATTTITRIIPGGSDADWSPVAYNPPTGTSTPGTKTIQVKGKLRLVGKPRVGKALTAKLRVTKPKKVTRKYVWLRNGKKIKGATKATLRMRKAFRGKKISVRVTLTARGYQRRVMKSAAVRIR